MTELSPPLRDQEADLLEKAGRLHGLLASYESVLVAFSGGADSAYLAWAATAARGESVLCVTVQIRVGQHEVADNRSQVMY